MVDWSICHVIIMSFFRISQPLSIFTFTERQFAEWLQIFQDYKSRCQDEILTLKVRKYGYFANVAF